MPAAAGLYKNDKVEKNCYKFVAKTHTQSCESSQKVGFIAKKFITDIIYFNRKNTRGRNK